MVVFGPVGPTDAKFFCIHPAHGYAGLRDPHPFAFRERSNPAAHKRFILIATIALIEAAIIRLAFCFTPRVMVVALPFWFLVHRHKCKSSTKPTVRRYRRSSAERVSPAQEGEEENASGHGDDEGPSFAM